MVGRNSSMDDNDRVSRSYNIIIVGWNITLRTATNIQNDRAQQL